MRLCGSLHNVLRVRDGVRGRIFNLCFEFGTHHDGRSPLEGKPLQTRSTPKTVVASFDFFVFSFPFYSWGEKKNYLRETSGGHVAGPRLSTALNHHHC